MHKKNILIWIFAILLISGMIAIGTIELVRSYKMRIQLVYTEADLSGYLVSEWIQKSLDNVRAVLKDSLYDIDHSNILASSIDEKERTARNKILVHTASHYDDIIFLGIFDPECVIQYGSIISIIGEQQQ